MSWKDDEIVGGSWQDDPVVQKPEVANADQAFDIAVGRGFDRLASGLRAAVPAPVRGALDKVDQFFGVQPPTIDPKEIANNEAEYAKVAKEYPKTAFVGEMVPTGLARNPVGMAVLGGLEYGTPAERATRAGLNYGAGKLGEYVGGKVADKLATRATEGAAQRATAKAQNAVRDATVREAQQAGYVIPPTQAAPEAPGMVNRILEGVSGKIQTAQAAAIKNQAVTNQLAKKALLLPEDAPLTRESIGAVRSAAGQVYNAVKGFGSVAADDEFRAATNAVGAEYRQLVSEIPSQNSNEINALLKDLGRDQFNSSTIVEWVKRLRRDGFANIVSPEPERKALGQIQIGAQGALEDLLERRVAAAGDAKALDVFRNARQLIAKSYTVEKALDEASGKVVAGKIGKEFSKGRPLTGELATIGKVAQSFPKAVQNVNSSMPGLSPLDAAFGAGTAVATSNPLMAALPFARPAIRAGLLSAPYQNAMVKAPSYAPGLADQLLAKGGENPELLKRLGGLLGLSAQRAYQ